MKQKVLSRYTIEFYYDADLKTTDSEMEFNCDTIEEIMDNVEGAIESAIVEAEIGITFKVLQ